MDMCVDQARNQGGPGSIDDPYTVPRRHVLPDRTNDPSLDHDPRVLVDTFAVEYANVVDEEVGADLRLG